VLEHAACPLTNTLIIIMSASSFIRGSVQTVEELVVAFAAIARPEIRKDHTASSCVASTWITIEVMRHFRVSARPLTVKAEICNTAFIDFEQRHGRRPLVGESAETWIVGIGFGKDEGYIGTHVITLVDERIIIDASIDQADAPEHGIVLPGVLWTVIDERVLAGESFTHELSSQRVIYIPERSEFDLTSYYDFQHNPETDSAVQRIVKRLEGSGFRPLGEGSVLYEL
jgi:hypothetical protein